MILRVALDVNVWVDHYLALSKGRQGSAAQILVGGAFAGTCRLGPVQPIISLAMLNTLHDVLIRKDFLERHADLARDAVESAAIGGVEREPPHLVFGGGVQPLRDIEDVGVLETAIAGRADLLITNNMDDFTPGPRADIDADVVREGGNGSADVVRFRHPKLQNDLVIASVFAAPAWMFENRPPPPGILERFLPVSPEERAEVRKPGL